LTLNKRCVQKQMGNPPTPNKNAIIHFFSKINQNREKIDLTNLSFLTHKQHNAPPKKISPNKKLNTKAKYILFGF